MAIYYPTIINSNYIGGVDSETEIIEPEATAISYNQFVLAAAASNFILDSIDIRSYDNNLVAVSQPLKINHIEIDGTVNTEIYVPSVSSLSFNSQIKDLSFKTPFLFNGLSSIEYPIVAGELISITLNAKKRDRIIYPNTDFGRDELSIRTDISTGEDPEEKQIKQPKAEPIAELQEPEETVKPKKDKPKQPEIKEVKPLKIEDTVPEVSEYLENWAEQADNVIFDLARFQIEEQKKLEVWDTDAKIVVKESKVKGKRKQKPIEKTETKVDEDKTTTTSVKWNEKTLRWQLLINIKNEDSYVYDLEPFPEFTKIARKILP